MYSAELYYVFASVWKHKLYSLYGILTLVYIYTHTYIHTYIHAELYYVFASVWGHKLYSLYGILTLVFIILIVVTSFITIALTYFQLAIEDHHWWWRSIFSGGSTGIFIFFYCIYCEFACVSVCV
jgi:hypothetical protein